MSERIICWQPERSRAHPGITEGAVLPHLAGCIDLDIWQTPFTATFPIRRVPVSAR